ncbi:carbamoyl-phosphate synthase L chain, ATP binding domain-containing protein [Chytridium lagenaria]|nr:carbamoyl-phosphate synthase L chain, ATP binding domain-containing protein [Chytridium lagenaria]
MFPMLKAGRAVRTAFVFRRYASSAADGSRKPLFDKILIANRGEIACRVMRTAKKLGIKSADEAFLIGPAASQESYLKMEKIIDVAKRAGAQAIHPGYGFLSENASFADLVKRSGLEFIGPPAQAIIDMGSKSASKEIMIKANVPVVPGYHGANQDPEYLQAEAGKMGYPVLIKAVKGGGGKGMRIVDKEADFMDMLESSKREAIKSFGDDTVLVEKYIVRPRHVEVQVFADKFGNAVYLFERDCSVQRRHQKILEEAPAPHLSPELRLDLGQKAVAAAKAVNYVGAGTHPVTEMITDTDLVEWQLEVASGNRSQKYRMIWLSLDMRLRQGLCGNPDNGFLPDTGPLRHLSFPPTSTDVRIETGVRQGDEVSVHYDPMISKLVVRGENRTAALRVLRKALGEFEVVGLNTNIDFLKRLASHPAFIDGDVETGFIKVEATFLGLIGASQLKPVDSYSDPWSNQGLTGFRLNHASERVVKLLDGEKKYDSKDVDLTVVDASGKTTKFEGARVLGVEADGNVIADIGDRRVVGRVGEKTTIGVPLDPGMVSNATASSAGSVKTPMPCKISAVSVAAGQEVTKGQNLIILEAMKMEHVIKSPRDGKIKKVHYKVGDLVGEGKNLVTFEGDD